MTKQTIIFLLSFGTLALGLSFFTSYVYTKVFPMSVQLSYGVKIAGVVFPLLFILVNVLSRVSEALFVKWLYTIVNVGAGFAFYLLLGALVLGFLFSLYTMVGASMSVYLSKVVLIIVLILPTIGLLQARTITKVSHQVALENLPPEWQGKKAILFSDSHYGLVNHTKAARRLVRVMLQENPDMVFIAGDLFDGPNVTTDSLTEAWKDLSLTTPVFYAPGNHEEYGDYRKFLQATQEGGFTILEDSVLTHNGVQIAGILYRAKGQESEVSNVLKNMQLDQALPAILISHPPTFLDIANAENIDLMFSGHTHKGQFWPLNYITKAIYGNYHYGLHTYADLQVLTTSGVGTAGPPFRLFNTPEIVEITFVSK